MPPVPREVHSMAGPVRVVRVRGLIDPKTAKPLYGHWDPATRTIRVERDLGPETALQTLYHEQFHAWVDDLGVNLPERTLEQLCDGYAMGRMGERWVRRR